MFIRPSEELKNTSSESTRRGTYDTTSHLPVFEWHCHSAVGVGTITIVWLPRLQRAVPSVSLDKSEYLIGRFISQKIFVDK
jgi:hypothetical protein